mgnify:CR=1 FL=1
MKRFHRRCRRLCILAALLVLLVLFLGTRLGLSIRATGDNTDMVRAYWTPKAGGYWRRNVLTSVLHRLP